VQFPLHLLPFVSLDLLINILEKKVGIKTESVFGCIIIIIFFKNKSKTFHNYFYIYFIIIFFYFDINLE